MSENNIINLDDLVDKFIYYKNQSGQLLKENDKKKYRSAIEIFAEHFEIRERGLINISDKMLKDFYYELKGNFDYSDNTIKSYMSRFLAFYNWIREQEQAKNQITMFKENVEPTMKTTVKKDTKKVNFNLDAEKFKKLSTLEFLRKMNSSDGKITLTDLINEAIDDYLGKHQKEIERIEIK